MLDSRVVGAVFFGFGFMVILWVGNDYSLVPVVFNTACI
jgi:hypothetical protein